jgi:hypothetical protein
MTPIRREDLEALTRTEQPPCLSLYAPMVQAGPQTRQNVIRFRNLVRRADEMLAERDMRPLERERFLEPLTTLAADEDFWLHQLEGLAVFRSADRFVHFRLPTPCEELVTLGKRFHVTRLIDELNRDGSFRVLALSHDDVRLYECNRQGLYRRVLPPEVPTSIAQALGPTRPSPADYQHANFKQPGDHQPGAGGNFYHGQSYGDADPKRELRKFFTMVDEGIFAAVDDKDVPVVLAGVDYVVHLYRDQTRLPDVVEQSIQGHPADLGEQALYEKAWAIMAPWLARSAERARERWAVRAERGRASKDMRDVLVAASEGRVETLLLARDAHAWGTYDAANRKLVVDGGQAPQNEDLLELAAVETWRRRGAVYTVDRALLPDPASPIAALYRY